ncbi:hypothetical protein [Streptomyces sp. NPDC057740]|uniref:hypothetical protein n=1 Tax=Streptomyces sp. NPDC057740 TaxID=3346234 RepID=UPI00368E2300
MDWNLTAAIASAACGGASAGVAAWQAVIARSQARAARGDAATATAAADLARRQAVAAEQATRAAEEQVELMRHRLDTEDTARREARGPEFDIKGRGASRDMPRSTVKFEFTQVSGPAIETVQVSASGEGIQGLYDRRAPGAEGEPSVQTAVEVGPVSQGGKVTVHVGVDPAIQHTVPVRFTLICRAEGSTDSWQRSYTADVHGPARVSSPVDARSRRIAP